MDRGDRELVGLSPRWLKGKGPCAVPHSADMALDSKFQTKPMSIFYMGAIRTIFASSYDKLTIFSASLEINAVWSRDLAK